jgi:hypothetical protein
MKGSPLVNGLFLVVLERWRMLNYEWTCHRILTAACEESILPLVLSFSVVGRKGGSVLSQ